MEHVTKIKQQLQQVAVAVVVVAGDRGREGAQSACIV